MVLAPRNRIRRDWGLSRAKPSASSGASVLRTGLISTADPSRSTTGAPCAAERGGRPAKISGWIIIVNCSFEAVASVITSRWQT
jgi:hypothetical protein